MRRVPARTCEWHCKSGDDTIRGKAVTDAVVERAAFLRESVRHDIEFRMVEEMVEAELLKSGMARQPPAMNCPASRQAFAELSVSPQLALLNRYEVRLHRMY